MHLRPFAIFAALPLIAVPALAHPGHEDNAIIAAAIRDHGTTAAATLPKPEVKIEIKGAFRIITGNGLPNHETGKFPNRGNPNAITAQQYAYQVPVKPKAADKPIALVRQPFGIALNGVLFDPATAGWWSDDEASGWHIEAMIPGRRPGLGIDQQLAHVQPNGAYHYHGLPPALVSKTGGKPEKMVLIGWAADGYPIYGGYAHADAKDAKSPLKLMVPSFALKKGARPAGSPGGKYDGTYTQDYERVKAGDLDECNGREGVTPEFPEGTYYYVATTAFPYIPRAFHGVPDDSFKRRGNGHPGGRRGRPGGRQGGPNGPNGQDGPPRRRPGHDGPPPDADGPPDGPPPQ